MKKILLLVLLFLLAACTGQQEPSTTDTYELEAYNISEVYEAEVYTPEAYEQEDYVTEVSEPYSPTIRIAAMRGPTALGLLPLMDGQGQGSYEFELLGSPDEVPPLLARADVDIAVVPANLAAVLYNRMDGDVQALSVVTLGVLHIVDTTDTIHSIEDLSGRTIYLSGQGATPEFALNYVLTQNGLTPGVDVNIEFRTEHAEIAALLETGQAEIALLPEPFISTVLAQIDGLRLALDLTEEWDRVQQDYSLIMSVVLARREFVENNPTAITILMEEYANSIEFMTNNIIEGAQLAADFGLIPNTTIGEAALPRTHLVFMTGEEMRRNLTGFYSVLYNAEPASIGGELVGENFFFMP